jgi:hypothetical protein
LNLPLSRRLDRRLDELGAVVDGHDLRTGGQAGCDLREPLFDVLDVAQAHVDRGKRRGGDGVLCLPVALPQRARRHPDAAGRHFDELRRDEGDRARVQHHEPGRDRDRGRRDDRCGHRDDRERAQAVGTRAARNAPAEDPDRRRERGRASTVLQSAGDHRTPAKPLDFVNPGRVHVPRPGATLSADDRPMDIGQVRLCDRADERLERDEAHGSRHLSQFVQSAENLRILDGRTEPNIGKDLEFRSGQDLSHPIGPLRQNLIGVLGCLLHHLPDTRDELGRHLFMKKVRHGIYKDEPRLRPGRRNFERFWIEADLARPHRAVAAPARKAAILRLPHGIEPSRHPHGIAVGAAGGEHGATRDGIPGRVRPFDCGVGHVEPRSSTAIARFALARPVRRAQRARFCGRSPGAHDTFVPEMKYVAHSLFGLCSAANRWCAFIDARSKRSPPEIAV